MCNTCDFFELGMKFEPHGWNEIHIRVFWAKQVDTILKIVCTLLYFSQLIPPELFLGIGVSMGV